MRELNSWAEINLRNLAGNAREVMNLIGEDVALMAVVKANAYGHGLIKSALALWTTGAQWLCVNDIEEAVALRETGIKCPILILGYVPPGSLADVLHYDLSMALYDIQTARLINIECAKQKRGAFAHIKVDTGMRRLGVMPEELPDFLRKLADMPAIKVQAMFSHFAKSADLEVGFAQLKQFQNILFALQRQGMTVPMVHMANSYGMLNFPAACFDGVRAGRILYGLVPDRPEIQPVMTVKSRIAMVKKVKRGEPVGYNQDWVAPKNSIIAVVAIGYADGVPWSLSNTGEVLIAGKRCGVVGRVCMNMLMVDVTHIPVTPKPGEEVVIIGRQGNEMITAADVAENAGTSELEIVTRVSPALPRVYIE